ncbi:MAG TPA: hypothetical protein VMT69_12910 [Kineosporiaceae bacterium]|nr:hypothetical protein [Kineosporiaceae bacterium]
MTEETFGSAHGDPPDDRGLAPVVLEALVDTIGPLVPAPVDELHVASVLESRGVTDRLAQERYRHPDVFALAATILPELRTTGAEPPPRVTRVPTWRVLVHGPLYLAPSLVIPALLALGDQRRLLAAVITATAIGWLWGMATSVIGYQLRGQRREAGAASAIQLMTAAGVLLTAVAAISLTVLHMLDGVAATAMTAQTAFQLAAGILVFYRQELVLAAAVVPAVALGALYLGAGAPSRLVAPALAGAAATIALAVVAAGYLCRRAGALPDGPGVAAKVGFGRNVAPSVAFAASGAVLLLFTDAHFFGAGLALALAAVPLLLGMGAVEWRAQRFVELAADDLLRARDLQPFRSRLWRALARDLAAVLAVLAGLAAALVGMLALIGAATGQGVVLAAGHVALGAVFFLCFVLSRHEHFPWIVAGLAAVALGYVAAVVTSGGGTQQAVVAPLFLVTATSLVVLLVGAFAAAVRSVVLFVW